MRTTGSILMVYITPRGYVFILIGRQIFHVVYFGVFSIKMQSSSKFLLVFILAFSLKYTVCHSWVVIDHMLIAIPINLMGFTNFFLFFTLLIEECLGLKTIMSFQCIFFAGICIGSEIVKEMLLLPQNSEFKSTTQSFWREYIIYSFW